VIAWPFWAVCALLEGYVIAFVSELGNPKHGERIGRSAA